MSPYLTEVEGRADEAVDLYVWNVSVTAEFWKLIGYTEVALRNAISDQLDTRPNAKHIAWFDDPRVISRRAESYKKIAQAKATLAKLGKDATVDRLIAELNFGFWQQLVSKRSRHLWPTISRGFKGLTSKDPRRLSESLQTLRLFRNRIAHHYKIWHLDLENQYLNIIEILEMIDPKLAIWVVGTDSTLDLVSRRPNCRRLKAE